MRLYRKKRRQINKTGSPFIQPKLNIGKPGDKYELEADAMANKVMNKTSIGSEGRIQKMQGIEEDVQQKSLSHSITPFVQKQSDTDEENVQPKCVDCEKEESVQRLEEEEDSVQKMEEEEETVQAKSNHQNHANSSIGSSLEKQKGIGGKMDISIQYEMEQDFGTDFSNITIHTDTNAVEMNKQLNAQAFAHGNDVYFNQGKYDPSSTNGKRLLAHELTHVVQQQGGKGALQRKTKKKDRFDALAPNNDPSKVLDKINPALSGRIAKYCMQNCPATASALNYYLRTGTIKKAHCSRLSEGPHGFGYEIHAKSPKSFSSWKGKKKGAKKYVWNTTSSHGKHVVIEGNRGDSPPSGLSQWHYFIIVNIRGRRLVVDAFTRSVTTDIEGYLKSLKTTSYAVYSGEFKTKPTVQL